MKNIIWLAGLFVTVSCNENHTAKHNAQEIRILKTFKLSDVADSIFKEYVKEFPTEPAYAIFIDKKTGTEEYMITVAPFLKATKSIYESGAVNYFMLSDTIPVFLYTGLEDFVVSDTPEFVDAKKRPDDVPKNGEFKNYDPINRKVDFSKSWSYIHLDTAIYVVKGNPYPFISTIIKPTIQFMPPDSSIIK